MILQRLIAVTTPLCLAACASHGSLPAPSVPVAPTSSNALATRRDRAPIAVPFELVNNHVHLVMTSGGRELALLLDTGAGQTLMDRDAAKALGFTFGDALNVGGAGPAVIRANKISGIALTLPQDSTFRVFPSIAMPMAGLNTYEGHRVDGIMGADFIRQSVLQLDYANQQLILHDSRSFHYAGTGTRLRLYMREGHPHVSGVIVLPDDARLKADCVIDVGASSALLLTKPFVEKNRVLARVGPTIRRKAGRGAGGSAWANIGRVKAVRLGDAELTAPVTGFYGDSAGVLSTDASFECNIGGDILRRFNVYLDYARLEMILEPNAMLHDPFVADMSGAAFGADSAGAGLRVGELMPHGPAEVAGLAEGDLVLSVDGRPAIDYGLDALRKRFRREGGEVVLVVRRRDGEHTIRIPVRRLI